MKVDLYGIARATKWIKQVITRGSQGNKIKCHDLTAPGSSLKPSRACPERGRKSRFPIALCSSKCLSMVLVEPIESKSPGEKVTKHDEKVRN